MDRGGERGCWKIIMQHRIIPLSFCGALGIHQNCNLKGGQLLVWIKPKNKDFNFSRLHAHVLEYSLTVKH